MQLSILQNRGPTIRSERRVITVPLDFLESLGPVSTQLYVRERAFHHVGYAQALPVLLLEIVERTCPISDLNLHPTGSPGTNRIDNARHGTAISPAQRPGCSYGMRRFYPLRSTRTPGEEAPEVVVT